MLTTPPVDELDDKRPYEEETPFNAHKNKDSAIVSCQQ